MVLNKDFREFIGLLNAYSVKYLLVGGYAVGIYGYPGFTKDLDIWIMVSEENAENIIIALNQFGFTSVGLRKEDFLKADELIQLGYPPNRINIVMSCDGVEFDQCFKSRKQINVEGLNISVIDLENLKRNKKASGRPQDLADLDNLTGK